MITAAARERTKPVSEGRAIYNNTKQFIRYMVSSNVGEVICVFVAALIGFPETLLPIQLLWVNLVTDGLPAMALSFNKSDDDVMCVPPRHPSEPFIDRWMLLRLVVVGSYVGLATVCSYAWWFIVYPGGPCLSWAEVASATQCVGDLCYILKDRRPGTMAMSTLVVVEMFNVFNALSDRKSLLAHTPLTNSWLMLAVTVSMILHCTIMYVPTFARIFKISPLNADEWTAVFWLSFPVILVDEALKVASRHDTALRRRFFYTRGDDIFRTRSKRKGRILWFRRHNAV